MKIKKIKVNGETFLIQSYKKNSHANIICEKERLSFTIDLQKKKVDGTYGKYTEYWKKKADNINVDELILVLENYYKTKKS